MALLSENPFYEAFATRALFWATERGADFGECATTMERIGDGDLDAWHREWTATAERLVEAGGASARAGHRVSAAEAFLRASTYLRTANFPFFGTERFAATFGREAEVFAQAAALLDPPLQAVEIPFEGGRTLPGYLATVDGSGTPRRTLVCTNGYDSNIHEMYLAHAPSALRRGYNALLFDGPGQGRNVARDGLRMRPDWEAVVAPVLDWALARPEVHPDRVVLLGWSFGGFLAPRAAAFESSALAALVADPGQWDQRAAVARLPLSDEDKQRFPDIDPALLAPMEEWLRGPEGDPLLRWRLIDRARAVHGATSLYDYFAEMTRYEVSGVAERITCPTLLTAAEGDPTSAGAPLLLDAIGAERKVLVPFTAAEGSGGHCEGMARTLYHQRVFDWLDETLA